MQERLWRIGVTDMVLSEKDILTALEKLQHAVKPFGGQVVLDRLPEKTTKVKTASLDASAHSTRKTRNVSSESREAQSEARSESWAQVRALGLKNLAELKAYKAKHTDWEARLEAAKKAPAKEGTAKPAAKPAS